MSIEIDVLHALLRLARHRQGPTLHELTVRVRSDEPSVRRALFALARNGLVQRTPGGLRLSLAGLAVAVAAPKRKATPKPKSHPKEKTVTTLPFVRSRRAPRHRAA